MILFATILDEDLLSLNVYKTISLNDNEVVDE